MAKVKVSQLAKELGIETKELLTQLEKNGIKGKKSQGSLDEDEVSRIRTALSPQKSEVTIGTEKVVAERVVTEADQSMGEIQAREQVVERRVGATVIRRRTSRVEVISVTPPAAKPAGEPVPERQAQPEAALKVEAAEEVKAKSEFEVEPEHKIEVELRREAKVSAPSPAEERERVATPPGPSVAVSAREASALAAAREAWTPLPEGAPKAPVIEKAPAAAAKAAQPLRPAVPEAPTGVRVLGRIDLKTIRPEPPKPAPRQPARPEAPAAGAERQPAGDAEAGAAEGGEKPAKGVRHKKRVIKKQDLLEQREREFRVARLPKKKRALPGVEQKKTEITVPKASKRVIRMSEVISVGDLAREMGVKAGDLIKKLMGLGMMATINQMLDADTAQLVASEFDYQVENIAFDAETAIEAEHEAEEEEAETLVPRPAVVTIMGHVDHGKTSLLDAIRSANVTAQEAGGITQHIGAYHVVTDGRSVTFLDTPGHEAFTAMRARGAKITDIVVLVVAADDGVMPQTVEAINHARAAEVPIIVAINKIDRHDANQEKVRQKLSEYGLVSEDWGGDTIFVPVSARTKEGIPHLLEMLLLQTDVMDLKANPSKLARGTIVEAKLDRGRGPVATVLVQEGTLRVGDPFVCGVFYGRVRAMIDDQGHKIEEAQPSMPVEILGLQGVPQAGDSFIVLTDEAKARQVAEHRQSKQRESELIKTSKVSLEDLYEQIKTGNVKELRVVLKADVQGSVGALTEALGRLSSNEVQLRVIHGSVGGITESDVLLAAASNAIVIGFDVRPEIKAAQLAQNEGVDIRLYTIIYDVIADVKAAMEGLLEPTFKEQVHGMAEVRQVFPIRGVGTVAGCHVTDGKIQRSSLIRVLRDQVVVVREGKLASLKRFKDDVREVQAGYECGLAIEGYQDVKVGDVIEAYERVPVIRRMTPVSRGRESAQVSAAEKP